MKGECVATYKREIWYSIKCGAYHNRLDLHVPEWPINIKWFKTKEEAEKHHEAVGSITISSDSEIHVDIDEK